MGIEITRLKMQFSFKGKWFFRCSNESQVTVRPPIVHSISSYEFVLVRVYMLHIPRTHYNCTKCFGRELMGAGYLAQTWYWLNSESISINVYLSRSTCFTFACAVLIGAFGNPQQLIPTELYAPACMRIFGNTNLETIRILILHVNVRTNLFGDIKFWNIDFELAVNELPWVLTPAIAFW